jgi:hypothetical protein
MLAFGLQMKEEQGPTTDETTRAALSQPAEIAFEGGWEAGKNILNMCRVAQQKNITDLKV